MKKKNIIAGLFLFLILTLVFTYFFYHYAVNIAGIVDRNTEELSFETTSVNKPVVYVSVISRYPPHIIYSGYQPMLDYLTKNTAYRFELKLCDDYNQAVSMLINKEVVAAFLGSYVYIKAHDEYGVIPILKPLNSSFEPFSRSVLFTTASKNIFSLNDLKKKKLALPSKESYSTNWMLQYVFKKNNIQQSDLQEIVHFPHHQSVILNVTKELYDAGVTRENLIKRIKNRNIRILLYSDPYPTSPIVVTQDYSKPIVEAIKIALLKVGRSNSEREKITHGWDNEFIYGFVEATDRDYDGVRAISK
jgi:phosphonate transport system substrate-binding protein